MMNSATCYKSSASCLDALLRSKRVWGRMAEKSENLTEEATMKPGKTWKNIPRKPKDKTEAKKDWAMGNEIISCCLTPAVFREIELGVQVGEAIKDIPVPIINFFSWVKQHIRLCKSSKRGQIHMKNWFVIFLSFLSYYPKYSVYCNMAFTWASIPRVSCKAV